MLAAKHGRTEAVQLLAKLGSNVHAKNARGETALIWAARNGHADTVTCLLQLGASTTHRGGAKHQTAAEWAAEAGHATVSRLLAKVRPLCYHVMSCHVMSCDRCLAKLDWL